MTAGLWWVYFPTTATVRYSLTTSTHSIFPDGSIWSMFPDSCYPQYISWQHLPSVHLLTTATTPFFLDTATYSIPPDNLSLQYSSWRLLSSLHFLTTALRILLDRFYHHQHISLHRRLPVFFLTPAALFIFPDNYPQNIFWQFHPSVFPDSCYRSNSLV